jgi:hypothetical protein
MTIVKGSATIDIPLSEKFHHSAGGVHGSVYFKMLDDAAFFAANSLEPEFFCINDLIHHLYHSTCYVRKNESGR